MDSEVLLGALHGGGFEVTDMKDADIGIVNTCAFIEDAKRESIDTVLELVELKKRGDLSAVVVAGCLPQRYGEALLKGIPEVDAFIGCDQIPQVDKILERLQKKRGFCDVAKSPSFIYNHNHPRFFITPPYYIYVKISEGCGNRCSFCVIPSIKGAYRSRPMESIIEEVNKASESRRLSEINLIGQDTTLYGSDIYGRPAINDNTPE